MPLQGQALKTVARPRAGEHPLETCGLHLHVVEDSGKKKRLDCCQRKKMEDKGIDPFTSRMRSERSTI